MTWYTDFTNWLMTIPSTIRLIAIAAFGVVACLCLIRFLNKNVGKAKINWVFIALGVICVACIVFLCIYQ